MPNILQGLEYNTVFVQSLDGERSVDLTNGLISTDYFEDLLEPCVTAVLTVISSYNIIEALPIRGGELVNIQLKTHAGPFEKLFRVYKVSNQSTDKENNIPVAFGSG